MERCGLKLKRIKKKKRSTARRLEAETSLNYRDRRPQTMIAASNARLKKRDREFLTADAASTITDKCQQSWQRGSFVISQQPSPISLRDQTLSHREKFPIFGNLFQYRVKNTLE